MIRKSESISESVNEREIPSGKSGCVSCAGIFKQSTGARKNKVGIGLSYRPDRLHRLTELIPRNQLLSSLKV